MAVVQPATPPSASAAVVTTASDLLARMSPIAHASRRKPIFAAKPIFSEANSGVTSLSSPVHHLVRKPVRPLLQPI
ncbi:hypothetical protein ACFV4N_06585 [Actinosynnema sp. NPDC059797]